MGNNSSVQPAVVTSTAKDKDRCCELNERFSRLRKTTEELCGPLAWEDMVVQSMHDASPVKWQLAHTSWFFEKFVLLPFYPNYKEFNPAYNYLFNSYYNSIGPRTVRVDRGLISRPTVAEVFEFRKHVNERLIQLLAGDPDPKAFDVIELGLQHEQQHQELILTDIKHALSKNVIPVAYQRREVISRNVPQMEWHAYEGGVRSIGHAGSGYAFDNESPRHDVFIQPFELASRLVTNGEYMEFINDGGYTNPILWLSDGWYTVQNEAWEAPLYWEKRDGQWHNFTLQGWRPVEPSEPVTHISYFEADAFATWKHCNGVHGARLPTEFELEYAVQDVPIDGNFQETKKFHPVPAVDQPGMQQLFGDTWQWTRSSYSPYPGYHPDEGALGEYNGKFMNGQFVLRGGSCVTPQDHMRKTYRNFFAPHCRWQFFGIRLAKDVAK